MTDEISVETVLGAVSRFSPDQVAHLLRALESASSEDAVLAALEGLVGPERRCPWCAAPDAVKRGRLNGLMRYRCKDCGKTFNALTNSPLARLRMRGKWVLSVQSLLLGETLKKSAQRCDVHIETAHRWRHRLLGTSARRNKRRTIGGIVEVDDTRQRVSQKGSRTLDREPRKRGGAPAPGGTDQVHILVATDREGGLAMQVLEQMNTGGVRYSLSHILRSGTTLVTDAAKCFSSASRKMGVRHIKLNISAGQRTRGIFHIQTVNNLHARLHHFLDGFRGVATRYLPNYLEWFRLVKAEKPTSPIELLISILGGVRPVHA